MACGWMKASSLGALALVIASCGASQHEVLRRRSADVIDAKRATVERRGVDRAVAPAIIVTLDGARWQEVFLGTDAQRDKGRAKAPRALLPNLYRLASDRGALVGAPGHGVIKATGPNFVSLPGYTEIMTGRSPLGCQDNACPPVTTPTLLDEVYARGGRVAAFGSWEKLDRAVTVAPGRFTVSCGRRGDPAIDPFPGHGDYRPDFVTAYLALRHLWEERPDVLFLGLGDPDEYAHRDDYDGYLRSLGFADAIVGQIFVMLDQMGDRGARTHVFVTADHGRASSFRDHGGAAPESARVWLFAAGPTITARGRAKSDEHRLADLAPTLRLLMGLDADTAQEAGRPIAALLEPKPEAVVQIRR